MNCLCMDARALLKKSDYKDIDIRGFINNYNSELSKYSVNGLSSYTLECVEVSTKLSREAGYCYGESYARVLRGDILFYGGHYSLALREYEKAYELDKTIESVTSGKISFTKKCLGDDFESTSFKVSDDMDLESYLNLTELIRSEESSREVILETLDKLYEFGDGCCLRTHILSLKALVLNEGLDQLGELLTQFNKNESFILYVDGVLNIVETLVKNSELTRAEKLLDIVADEKRELKLFDNRIHSLSTRIRSI